ncbi:hypothetical protein [Eudoraea adriatica]|uniref:hypothetical protein n=1 Tax=Eudoraea adriatica TaxID=446681 RepID=UPI0012FB61BB|nr:hypothetical protein [Eudoraea adriatica]
MALFLSGLILLQSCSTYKTPVSLQQAVQEEKAVKIVTVDDDAYKYKYIVYEDGKFYGVKDNPGEDVKFPITVEEVEEVLMKKGLPWWAWALIGVAVIGIAIIIVAAGAGGGSYSPW